MSISAVFYMITTYKTKDQTTLSGQKTNYTILPNNEYFLYSKNEFQKEFANSLALLDTSSLSNLV